MNDLVSLSVLFGQLSLVAIGGMNTVLPELQRQVVEIHHWMPATTFAALFAIAQAAPGPNMLVATLIGWQVAGPAGAAIATLSLITPPIALTYTIAHAWQRFREQPWRRHTQAGLVPVTAGLVMAAATLLCQTTATHPILITITAATTALLLTTRTHPLWLLAAGAGVGAMM